MATDLARIVIMASRCTKRLNRRYEIILLSIWGSKDIPFFCTVDIDSAWAAWGNGGWSLLGSAGLCPTHLQPNV